MSRERERDIEYVMGCEGELKMFDLFAFGCRCSDYTLSYFYKIMFF
jgi:hypothetical protein